MWHHARMRVASSATAVLIVFDLATTAFGQLPPKEPTRMIHHAKCAFEVKVTTMPADEYADGKSLGRAVSDKQYHGDLDGSSKGQMLTAMSEAKGSAVYVATERVTGTLGGHTGTFLLAHRGVMNRGAQQLDIDVVPDSGTGELQGITGSMSITIGPDGKHFYDLEYTLPSN